MEDTSPKCKDSPHLFGGEPEEDKIAAMCLSGETNSVVQPNGVDEAYYKQLNQ